MPRRAPANVDPATGKRVLYWHDPMVPGQKFDKPGKSPFMDMQLVPVYADGDGDDGQRHDQPAHAAEPRRAHGGSHDGTLTPSSRPSAASRYNERDVAVVQARSRRFRRALHVRAPLDPVRKGQPLAELYVPDWVAAQEEYLAVERMPGDGARSC